MTTYTVTQDTAYQNLLNQDAFNQINAYRASQVSKIFVNEGQTETFNRVAYKQSQAAQVQVKALHYNGQ